MVDTKNTLLVGHNYPSAYPSFYYENGKWGGKGVDETKHRFLLDRRLLLTLIKYMQFMLGKGSS